MQRYLHDSLHLQNEICVCTKLTKYVVGRHKNFSCYKKEVIDPALQSRLRSKINANDFPRLNTIPVSSEFDIAMNRTFQECRGPSCIHIQRYI